MIATILSVVLTALPERYRRRWVYHGDVNVQRGALLSGFSEVVVALLFFLARYIWFIQYRPGTYAGALIKHDAVEAMADTRLQFSVGILSLMEYMIQPLTIFLVFLMIEGLLRGIAAVTTREVVPSLPLLAIAWIHGWFDHKSKENWLGPLVADVVRPGNQTDYDLKIESCRPREWTNLTTISYKDQLYELISTREQAPPRRFVFLLRKAPVHKLVRGLHNYHPDELLPKPETTGRGR